MHQFFEKSFDLENTFEYTLSIQVSLNGFSFSVLCPKENKVLAFKYSPLKISDAGLLTRRFKDWYKAEEILHKFFLRTRLIVFSRNFTLVPEQLFSSSSKEEIAHILFKDGGKLKLAENLLEPLNAKLLFSLPQGLMGTIADTIGECEIVHPVKLQIKALMKKENHPDELSLLFNNKELYLLVKSQNKLQLANSFEINHSNDAVYFILTTLSQMGMAPKQLPVSYGGISPFKEETEKHLQKYFATSYQLKSSAGNLSKEIINQNISLFY